MAEDTLEDLERRAARGGEPELLALADRFDALGRHTDAINALSRAAQAGGATAKGRVGARIIIGDRAPRLPDDGARLIAEAAAEGSGEASAVAAVLAGAGVRRVQSWPDALDHLQRAAEQGFARARGELAALSSDRALAEAVEEERLPSDLWGRLRASIDIATLTAAPEGRTLSEDPRIRAFEGFTSPAMCDWLIARSRPKLTRAEIYNPATGGTEAADMRTNTIAVFSLVDTDLVHLVVQARMAAATPIPFANMEAASVLHYSVGEEITEHYDFVDPSIPNYQQEIAQNGQRVVTFLVYLNDDYEGGETEFPRLGVSHKGKKGEGLFFSNALASGEADVRTQHAGRPPVSGEKWIVSQFIRNRPVIPGVRPAG